MSVKNRFTALVIGILFAVSAGAATFPIFGPSTGVLKGSATSPITTAATSADIISLWAGSCSVSTVLRGDGTCATPVSFFGAALTKTDDINVTLTLGGSPSTALVTAASLTLGWTGQLAASRGGTGVSSLGTLSKTDDTNVTMTLGGTPTGALITSTSMTLGWTGTLAASRGGLGMSTVTDDTVAVANGSTWQSKALTDCDTASSAVTYDTTANAWGCNTITGATGANPTGTIGLSAVNGVATTYIRSDGSPALSQAIAPTWSGQHTFSQPVLHADGAVGLPGLAFSLDPDTGLFRPSANTMAVSTGGVSFVGFGTALASGTGSISALSPNISSYAANFMGAGTGTTVGSNTNLRLASPSAGKETGIVFTDGAVWNTFISAVSNGALSFSVTGNGTPGERVRIETSGQLGLSDGAVGTPSVGFISDPDTGRYLVSSDKMCDSTGGTCRLTIGPGVLVGTATGGDKGAGTINATGVYVNGVSVGTGVSASNVSLSGVITCNGFSALSSCTGNYSSSGPITCLTVIATGTSNATTFTVSGIPSAQRPVSVAGSSPTQMSEVTDNAAVSIGRGGIDTLGVITFTRGSPLSASGWTASGTKGAGFYACYATS